MAFRNVKGKIIPTSDTLHPLTFFDKELNYFSLFKKILHCFSAHSRSRSRSCKAILRTPLVAAFLLQYKALYCQTECCFYEPTAVITSGRSEQHEHHPRRDNRSRAPTVTPPNDHF
jgi:hypothetical protein